MRKNFKRALAVLCAAALTTLSVAVAGNLSSLKTAAEVSPSGEINFGGDSAYLKLDNALTSAPASVEAEVKMPSTIKDEWTLLEGGKQDNTAVAGKVSNGITTDSDKPGAGLDYLSLNLTSSTISVFHNMSPIDISKYGRDELTLSFWAYSETAGKLADGGRIRLSKNQNGNDAGLSDNNTTLDIYASSIAVEAGWNYIELPLSNFTLENGGTLASIGCFKLHGIKANSDKELRIAEVKLTANTDNEILADAVDPDIYSKGYSVISNLGSTDTPYALFVTREGKPAFIYNDKMFVLNYNVCTGEFVKIGVTVNDDNTVTFKIGDSVTATSTKTFTAVTPSFTSVHSIGADAVGGTLMNGTIKNLVVSDDAEVVGNWTLAANKAYPLNAVKDFVGSNDAHFAGIVNSNAAVVVKYESATAGTAPADADDMDGYVFAGWFTDEACTKALTGTGVAYAKYVDKAVLTVKAQIKNGAASADKTDMRFVTTVDSLNYKSVGFVINNVDKTLSTVYTQLYKVGSNNETIGVNPSEVSKTSVSAYFATFTVTDIPQDSYGSEFNVTPYWITLDGTRVSGNTVVKSVSQGI